MRKIASLVVAFSLIGGALSGGAAMASERGDREVRVERRDEQPVRRRFEVPVAAPPVAPFEHVEARPGFVWVGGEYQWLNGAYSFVPGHYEHVRRGYHWAGSFWHREGGRYVRTQGRWIRG